MMRYDTSALRQRSRNKMLLRARPNLLQMTYVRKEKFQQHTDKRLKALCCCCCCRSSSSLFIWHATHCTTLQVRARDQDRGGGREEVERVEGKRCDNQRLKRDTSPETRTCCLGVLLRRTKSPPPPLPRHIWIHTGDSSPKDLMKVFVGSVVVNEYMYHSDSELEQ